MKVAIVMVGLCSGIGIRFTWNAKILTHGTVVQNASCQNILLHLSTITIERPYFC